MQLTETFGPEHRPIVEFALDNVQTLKQRRDKLQFQQQQQQQEGSHGDAQNARQNGGPHSLHERSNKPLRKRDSRGDMASLKNSGAKKEDEIENNILEAAPATKEGRFAKQQKSSPRKGRENKFPAKENQKLKNQKEERKPGGGESLQRKSAVIGAHLDERTKKRKFQDRTEQKDGIELKNWKRAKKNKDPLGRDAVDKLDMLIEQYRSKFSKQSGDKAGGEKQGSRQLGRWFQS